MYHKLWSDDVHFLRYAAQRTDGGMDGRMGRRKKLHIEVNAPTKNSFVAEETFNYFFALLIRIKNLKITQKRFFSFIIYHEFHRKNYIKFLNYKIQVKSFSITGIPLKSTENLYFMWLKQPVARNRLLRANFLTFWSYSECMI